MIFLILFIIAVLFAIGKIFSSGSSSQTPAAATKSLNEYYKKEKEQAEVKAKDFIETLATALQMQQMTNAQNIFLLILRQQICLLIL